MAGNITVLHENGHGIRIEREDRTRRSTVKVKNGNITILTYRMNNVPLYEHPYLSWANLDCCNEWDYDGDYLRTAVQEHNRLVAAIPVKAERRIPAAPYDDCGRDAAVAEAEGLGFSPLETDWDVVFRRKGEDAAWWDIIAARKGCLCDYFNLDEVIEAYRRQSTDISGGRLDPFFKVPLIELFAHRHGGFDYRNPESDTELIATGLGFGHPIESTSSIMHHF